MTDRPFITNYDPKPTPDRRWDWSACRDDDDDGECVGYGRTEAEAIADLLELEGCALDETEARAPAHEQTGE